MMKRICIWLTCLCGLMILSGDTFAQYSQTKCPPPKQRSWKERKALIKFPELIESEREKEKAKKSRKREQPVAKALRPEPVSHAAPGEIKQAPVKETKVVAVKEKKERPVRYKKERSRNAKFQKLNSREVASTKCPH